MANTEIIFSCYSKGTRFEYEDIEVTDEKGSVVGYFLNNPVAYPPAEHADEVKMKIFVPDFPDGEERIVGCPVTGADIDIFRFLDSEVHPPKRKIGIECKLCSALNHQYEANIFEDTG